MLLYHRTVDLSILIGQKEFYLVSVLISLSIITDRDAM